MNKTLTSAEKLVNTTITSVSVNGFLSSQTHRSGSGNGVSRVLQVNSKNNSHRKPKASFDAMTSASRHRSGSIVAASLQASMPKKTASAPVDPIHITSSSIIDPFTSPDASKALLTFDSPTSRRQNTSKPSLENVFPVHSLCESNASSSGAFSNTKISNSKVPASFLKHTFGSCQPSSVKHPNAQRLPPIKGVHISREGVEEHSDDFKEVLLLKDNKLSIVKVQKDSPRRLSASRPSKSVSRSSSNSEYGNTSRDLLAACSEAGTAQSECAARLDVSSPQAGWAPARHFLPLLLAQYAEQLSTLRGVPWKGAASANHNLLLLHRLQAQVWAGGQERASPARGRLPKLAGGKKGLSQPRVSPLAHARSGT